MVEVAERAVEAAWKIKNLDDYDRRLERAARRVDELSREHEQAALAIYEAVLMKSGRPVDEVREMVRKFRETFEDEEDALTIPRVSGIMNVEGDDRFFGDATLRRMTGQLLGQFQHRVAQYNYIGEREVLRRWADSYDTRLFIRRRIYDTEPVAGVVEGFDLPLLQYLRVIAGGNTVVPSEGVAGALVALGFDEPADHYEILAHAENLALHLDLPAPVVGEMLEDLASEGVTDFPEPPPDLLGGEGEIEGAGEEPLGPSGEDRAARKATRENATRGEEPSRVQDPQAKDAPGVGEERGQTEPAAPENGREGAPGKTGEDRRET